MSSYPQLSTLPPLLFSNTSTSLTDAGVGNGADPAVDSAAYAVPSSSYSSQPLSTSRINASKKSTRDEFEADLSSYRSAPKSSFVSLHSSQSSTPSSPPPSSPSLPNSQAPQLKPTAESTTLLATGRESLHFHPTTHPRPTSTSTSSQAAPTLTSSRSLRILVSPLKLSASTSPSLCNIYSPFE